MTASKIEWTDRSDWNPLRGCTRKSPGCVNCYAEGIAARFSDPGQAFHGFAERTSSGPRWTGKVEVQWDRVELPLRWRTPVKIFASSTSDFFHEALIDHDIAHLFGVMIAAHHLRGHTLQVLTKRADRMRALLSDPEFWIIANSFADGYVMERVDPLDRRRDDARATLDDYGPCTPPPGIWLGVSVEDQERADERVPDLLSTPAARHFLSCEPLLGPVDWIKPVAKWQDDTPNTGKRHFELGARLIDQVIVGGESGPGARPMHPDWARGLRDQCQAAGVPFFFKQWGEWGHAFHLAGCHGVSAALTGTGHWPEPKRYKVVGGPLDGCAFASHPSDHLLLKLGKHRAGRLLDGVEWSEFPA